MHIKYESPAHMLMLTTGSCAIWQRRPPQRPGRVLRGISAARQAGQARVQ